MFATAIPAIQGLCFMLAIGMLGRWLGGAAFWDVIGLIGATVGFGVFTYRLFRPRNT
jgi:hypothetical protein